MAQDFTTTDQPQPGVRNWDTAVRYRNTIPDSLPLQPLTLVSQALGQAGGIED